MSINLDDALSGAIRKRHLDGAYNLAETGS